MPIFTYTETTDDKTFITNMKMDRPDTYYYGLPAYYIYDGIGRIPDAQSWIKLLQLRKVGRDASVRSDIYIQGKGRWVLAVMFRALGHSYWKTIRFLYFYGRVFVPITPDIPFSWRYFAPYFLIRNLALRIRRR